MALPQLTDEQRADALNKAAAARRTRALLKEDIAAGKLTLDDLLAGEYGDYAEHASIVGKTKVSQILQSLPRIGKAKANELMSVCDISENRRLQGLGADQKRRLSKAFAAR